MIGRLTLLLSIVLMLGPGNPESALRDEQLQNRMATVHGTVRFLNHPELGETIAVATPLYFQRNDCGEIVVRVSTDLSGYYSIGLSPGGYRIFARYGTHEGETTDWLAPGQARNIELGRGDYKEFNVEMKFPE